MFDFALDLGDGITDGFQRSVGVGLHDGSQLGVLCRPQLLEEKPEPLPTRQVHVPCSLVDVVVVGGGVGVGFGVGVGDGAGVVGTDRGIRRRSDTF